MVPSSCCFLSLLRVRLPQPHPTLPLRQLHSYIFHTHFSPSFTLVLTMFACFRLQTEKPRAATLQPLLVTDAVVERITDKSDNSTSNNTTSSTSNNSEQSVTQQLTQRIEALEMLMLTRSPQETSPAHGAPIAVPVSPPPAVPKCSARTKAMAACNNIPGKQYYVRAGGQQYRVCARHQTATWVYGAGGEVLAVEQV